MIGKRFGDYEIVEEIGKGGMATVFRAYQPRVGRFVAVKVLHAAIALDDTSLERFQREAQLVARLEHPHLLPLYDYDGANDPPYIVMRYLESGTLADVLKRERLPWGEVAHIFQQICAGLDYAHRNGVVHRDIKPSNIMVDGDGNAFVTDFGIARSEQRGLTQTGFAVGTPGYMSPEQAVAQDDVDFRSDIYALGVMLFEVITGQMPYSGETPMAVLLKHLQSPVPDPRDFDSEIHPAMAEVIMKAMAKDRDDRFQGANEFAAAISDAVYQSGDEMRGVPTQIRRAAQSAIREIQQERGHRSDEIEKTMTMFEATRRDMTKPNRPTEVFDAGMATVLTPSDQQVAQSPKKQPPMATIIAAVVVVLLLLVGAFVIFRGGDDPTPQPTVASVNITTAADSPTRAPQQANTAEPTPSTPVAAAIRQLPMRQGPANSYPVMTQLAPNEEVTLLGISENGAWYQIQTGDTVGWIPSSGLQVQTFGDLNSIPIAAAPTNTPTDTPTVTATATQTSTPTETPTRVPTNTPSVPLGEIQRNVTVRVGPARTYPEVTTLRSGDILELTGISEDGLWFQVMLPNGDMGWMSSDTTIVQTAGNLAILEVASAPTNTPTNTATATSTATQTPTATSSPTVTASPTNTLMPSPVPTDTPAVTHTPMPTATPLPGRLPYVADFESGVDGLRDWDFDPTVWQLVNEGGENLLIGQGRLTSPMAIVGRAEPEWLESTGADFVGSFRVNLDPQSAGLRYVFRYSDQGYYVLEIFPGLVILKRNATTPNLFDRTTERVLTQANGLNLSANTWHDVRVWMEGARIYVYLNEQLVVTTEDLIAPQLGAGQMLLQVNSTTRPVRIDDIQVQRADVTSEHFQSAGLPTTWRTTNTANAIIEQEGSGNQYLAMNREAIVSPNTNAIADLNLSFRVWVAEGGYRMNIRDSAAGKVRFELEAGNLRIEHVDGADIEIASYNVSNFYNRNRWEDVTVNFIGDRLRIYRDGRIFFDEVLEASPPAGTISFETTNRDVMRLDDVLITETAASRNQEARFAYTIVSETQARLFRELRSDLSEDFDDIFRTDDWWVNGQNAEGEFVNDPQSNTENQQYMRMTHQDRPTSRLFRDVIGVEIFGAGNDARDYRDSTDIYATVLVRFPDGTGRAWLGVRTRPSIAGANVLGYLLEMERNSDGTAVFRVRYETDTTSDVLYEGIPPALEGQILPPWVMLEAVTYHDRLAFFVDENFLFSLDNAQTLGGTMALGVEDGTTAHFDTLIIRDTTPHDQ